MDISEAIRTNPFPGLRSFEEDEDYLFFGRERQVDELLSKLRTTRFLAVIGASGSGKSSLVKCGLLPSLYSGFMATAGSDWRVLVFRPGSDPIGNMAEALAKPEVLYAAESMEFNYEPMIEATLRRSRSGLVESVRHSELDTTQNLLIVVDQFEEIFRFSRYEKQAQKGQRDAVAFINMLMAAASQTEVPVYVVLTMRSDFLGDCTEFRGLPEAINDGQYLIPRMTRTEIRTAITGPIAVAGGLISDRLVTRLLNDVGDNPDQLPILQHALMRTWDNWEVATGDGEPMDIQHYDAIGRMEQALSQHAEEAFAELETGRQQGIAEILFRALTEKGTNQSGVRRPTSLAEIIQLTDSKPEEVETIVEVFRRPGRSFLMPPAGTRLEQHSIIDISHESLMRIWTRLIGWVEQEAKSAETYLRLADSAALYQKGETGLLRNPELELALNWQLQARINKTWAMRYDPAYERAIMFLEYSHREFEAEQEHKKQKQKRAIARFRIVAVVLASLVFMSFLFLIFAVQQKTEAENNAEKAEQSAQAARDSSKAASAARILAEHEHDEAELAAQVAKRAEKVARDKGLIAEQQSALALDRLGSANAAKAAALRSKQAANDSAKVAQAQRAEAQLERDISQRLTLLALAKAMSNTAVREAANNPELARLVALQAYTFTRDNGGDPLFTPELFKALSQVGDPLQAKSEHPDAIRALSIDHKRNRIITTGTDGNLLVKNASNFAQEAHFNNNVASVFRSLLAVESINNGNEIAAGDAEGNLIWWSLANPAADPASVAAHSGAINALQYDQQSNRLFSGGSDGQVLVWKLTGAVPAAPTVLITGNSKILSLCLSADGQQLAIGKKSGEILLVPTAGGTPVSLLHSQGDAAVKSLAFTADGADLAAGFSNGKIAIWKVNRPAQPHRVLQHGQNAVNGLAFRPDGAVLVSGGADAKVLLWNCKGSGSEAIALPGHTGAVAAVQFLDATRVVAVSADHSTRIWITDATELARNIYAQVNKTGRDMTTEEWKAAVSESDAIRYRETRKDYQKK